MAEGNEDDIAVTAGSDNVFADLGFAEPEEELTKAELASHIRQAIRQRRLTQAAAAKLMGLDQPKVSALLNGRLANFSSARLMRLLTTLGEGCGYRGAAEECGDGKRTDQSARHCLKQACGLN